MGILTIHCKKCKKNIKTHWSFHQNVNLDCYSCFICSQQINLIKPKKNKFFIITKHEHIPKEEYSSALMEFYYNENDNDFNYIILSKQDKDGIEFPLLYLTKKISYKCDEQYYDAIENGLVKLEEIELYVNNVDNFMLCFSNL